MINSQKPTRCNVGCSLDSFLQWGRVIVSLNLLWCHPLWSVIAPVCTWHISDYSPAWVALIGIGKFHIRWPIVTDESTDDDDDGLLRTSCKHVLPIASAPEPLFSATSFVFNPIFGTGLHRAFNTCTFKL